MGEKKILGQKKINTYNSRFHRDAARKVGSQRNAFDDDDVAFIIARPGEALSCKMSLYVIGTAPGQIWIRKLLLRKGLQYIPYLFILPTIYPVESENSRNPFVCFIGTRSRLK